MSGYSENTYFSSGKGSNEDKLYENSITDSGFLSGQLNSEEIKSEEIIEDIIEEEITEEKHMRLDSGLDLGLLQTFSSLNLDPKTSGLNNLSPKTRTNEYEETESKNSEEKHPWEFYYRQDEDGDT